MDPSQTETTRPEKWILRLLYAPENGESATPIEGRTRLVKGLFLIERMFDEKFSDFNGTGFDFRPYKYGPFDEEIYHTLENLEQRGLVTEQPNGAYEGDLIELTPFGKRIAEPAYDELPTEQQFRLSWIKRRHVQQPVAQLLTFVYRQYPDMAENSEYTTP
jgi:hypothetical protein